MSAAPRLRHVRCVECGHQVREDRLSVHMMDTGAAESLPEGACPELFIRRNNLDRSYVCATCCEEHGICECELEPTDSQIEAYLARAS